MMTRSMGKEGQSRGLRRGGTRETEGGGCKVYFYSCRTLECTGPFGENSQTERGKSYRQRQRKRIFGKSVAPVCQSVE